MSAKPIKSVKSPQSVMSGAPGGSGSERTVLTRELCREHLDHTAFRLRAKDYGEKYPKWPGEVGLEIEMLPVRPRVSGGIPESVILQGPGPTIASMLRAEAQRRGWMTEDTPGDAGAGDLLLKVGLDDSDQISFEPGGQVEFSSRPYPCLSDAVRRMRQMQGILDAVFAEQGVHLVQLGVNPWHTTAELGLQMPKARYRAMDHYFGQIGEYGRRMMRQSCTMQANLDFGPTEDTLVRRYLGSQLLAPFAAATFAISPAVDRKNTGIRGFRTRIWRHADPTHTGLPSLAAMATMTETQLAARFRSREACVDEYLEFALNAHVVFIAALDYQTPGISFGEWLTRPVHGVRPTLDDFITHLTLLFPEVRPRGFLELRSVDCQPRAFGAVPPAYWTGLLYNDKALDALIALLLPERARIPELLNQAEDGLAPPALTSLAYQVAELAIAGFAALPSCFKADGAEQELSAYIEHFTARGRTPADDMLDLMLKEQNSYPSFAGYQALAEQWSALLT